MNVIVTGANGFIGSNLIKKLFEKNVNVFAVVQDPRMDVSSIRKYCQSVSFCDIQNIESIKEKFFGLKGETVFVHLAWRGVNGADKGVYSYQLDNIRMLCDAAVFAKEIGCSKFVAAGTVAENAVASLQDLSVANKGLFYGTAKYSGHLFLENLCKNIGLPFVWAQFSNIYGPGNKTGNLISYTLTQLNNNAVAEFGPADQPYDFVYLDDLIEALSRIIILKTNRSAYYLGSGEPRVLRDYLLYVGKRLGKESLIGIGKRPSDGIKYSFDMFDIHQLVADVGEYVTTSFEEGIEKTIVGGQQ